MGSLAHPSALVVPWLQHLLLLWPASSWNRSEIQERKKFSLALQLLDHDIVQINNHLGTPGHHPLMNVAPLLQSPDSQASLVQLESKTVYLSLIREREHDYGKDQLVLQTSPLFLLDTQSVFASLLKCNTAMRPNSRRGNWTWIRCPLPGLARGCSTCKSPFFPLLWEDEKGFWGVRVRALVWGAGSLDVCLEESCPG